MFGLGFGELVVILVIVVLVFGGSRLPELGRGLGEGLRSFRVALRTEHRRGRRPPPAEDPPEVPPTAAGPERARPGEPAP